MTKEAIKKENKSVLKVPKSILFTGKLLQLFSLKLVAKFAARLFITPFKHAIPRREFSMDKESKQTFLNLPHSKKQICVYKFGTSQKKILLVHGWSGRGTQLVKFAEKLVALGYQTISFDAPAHGKATGKTTDIKEFIEAALFLSKKYGPFYGAIGHSLGGMTLLNAIAQGMITRKIVIIGSGDIVTDIMDDFIRNLELRPQVRFLMQDIFEKRTNELMNDYSASKAAKFVNIPVLVIHDKDDKEVSVKCAYHLHENLSKSEIFITSGLGHRKILGNGTVVDKTMQYINRT
ncbi:alpha/beta hydrolase [Ascidiimonas sp. W6]|uniref:alpha/beta hydrolase n=1 Tax=Ascidiimonas meishanensis TaxID=3128903 RepID=UPI0030EB4F7A